MESIKKNNWIIIVIIVIVVVTIVYVVRQNKKKSTPSGGTIPQVEIQNNPIEDKVPEINPVERANPFKYKNPLLK